MKRKIIRHGATAGGKPTRGYSTWKSMRARCLNPRHADYRNYGGRGIGIVARWNSFAAFSADMGEPPEGMSLDRIDPNGDYGPDNCRWATRGVQNRNKRGVTWITIGPFEMTAGDWAVVFKVLPQTADMRIKRGGWDPREAVSTPRLPYGRPKTSRRVHPSPLRPDRGTKRCSTTETPARAAHRPPSGFAAATAVPVPE